jgi:enoyl-CoA hydratase/carnithine racemase
VGRSVDLLRAVPNRRLAAVPDPPELHASLLEVADRVARLTLDRDDVRNELTGTGLADEITAVARWVNEAPEVSVLVITGAGRAFSAGGNIKDMRAREGAFAGDVHEVQDTYRRGIQQMTLAMHAIEVPAIAAVNGAAIGAGLDLACMCDIRIAASGAKLGETFVNLGVIPGDGGAWFLQRLVGYQAAALLTFTGRVIEAEEALRIGLVTEVVAPEQLQERAGALAAEIAAKPPRAIRLTKRLLKGARQMELAEVLELSALFQGMSHASADHLEAVAAFLEKRAPTFSGR